MRLLRFLLPAILIVAALAPLAARADLWIHTNMSVAIWPKYGCRATNNVMHCDGNGHANFIFPGDNVHSCALRWWETGTFKFTWHAEVHSSYYKCTITWKGGNTIEMIGAR